MNDNLYPLRVFVAVAEARHVTRAAERLGITQPAVSAHLRALAEHFQDRLFLRGSTGMQLTPLGEAVLHQARAIFTELDELERIASGARSGGPCRIAASNTPGVHWLPSRVQEFSALHPDVSVSYSIADSAQVQTAVLSYAVPFGLVGDLPVIASNPELWHQEIARDTLQLMCAAGNRLAGKRQVRKAQLSKQTLILREPGSSTRAQAEKMLAPVLDGFARVLELNSNEAIKEAVIAGLGLAVLSSWTVAREVQSGELGIVGETRWFQSRPIYLIRRADRPLRGPAELLWDFLNLRSAEKRPQTRHQ